MSPTPAEPRDKPVEKAVAPKPEPKQEMVIGTVYSPAGQPVAAAPSGLRFFMARLFRETHHADVLENWGKLWMWHSAMIFLLCLLTQAMKWYGLDHHVWYMGVWSVGLVTWGGVLWQLRKAAGPVLFVERQIAHAWAAGVCASIAMFWIEWLIPLPALTLSPAVAVADGGAWKSARTRFQTPVARSVALFEPPCVQLPKFDQSATSGS